MLSNRVFGVAASLMVALALVASGCGSKNKASSASGVPAASAKDSLFTEANLKPALAAIRARVGGVVNVATLKIEPRAASATVKQGGKLQVVSSDKAGTVQVAPVPVGIVATFRMSKVDASVPGKMLDTLSKKYGKKLEDVDYMVALADPISKKPFWDIFVRGGVQGPYQADIDGSNLSTAAERASAAMKAAPTTPAPSPAGPAPATGTGTTIPPDIAKIQQCVTKAGNDPAKAAACVTGAQSKAKTP